MRSSSPTGTVSRGVADERTTDPERAPLLHRAGTAAAGVGSLGEGRPKLRTALQYGLIALIFAFLPFFLISQWTKLPNYDWRFRPRWILSPFPPLLAFFAHPPH